MKRKTINTCNTTCTTKEATVKASMSLLFGRLQLDVVCGRQFSWIECTGSHAEGSSPSPSSYDSRNNQRYARIHAHTYHEKAALESGTTWKRLVRIFIW